MQREDLKQEYDIVIVGGGMVGTTLACALAAWDATSALSVLIVDAQMPVHKSNNAGRKNWNLNNFLDFHCTMNKQDYKIVKSKMEQYGLPVCETHYLLLGKATSHKTITDKFKLGNFKIPAGGIANFDDHMVQMAYINNVFNEGNSFKRRFIRAFSIMKRHPKYDFQRFKTALKTKAAKLLAANNSDDYILQFDNIYNSGLRDKNKRMNLIQFTKDRDFEKDYTLN